MIAWYPGERQIATRNEVFRAPGVGTSRPLGSSGYLASVITKDKPTVPSDHERLFLTKLVQSRADGIFAKRQLLEEVVVNGVSSKMCE
jgi:hypothetical protein